MKKIYFVATLAILATLCGCSQAIEGGESEVVAAKSELSIGLPIEISRTTTDDNGKSSWADGDSFLLWAQNRAGGFNITGAEFKMMYYWQSLQSAVFTSNTNTIAEGEYTYYAVSPTPELIDNQKATYTLPNEQQGDSFNGAYDILVATPLTTDAIVPDKVNNLALDFNHKMHVLKMTIPQGGNPLKNPVSRIVFTFPTAVTGSFAVNVLNPNEAPTISRGSKQLIIDVPNGFDEGESAWGVILPGNISGTVSYYVVSTIGERTLDRTFKVSKEFKGGHITPLSLTIPEPIPPTTLRFSVGSNQLGEEIQTITILDHNKNILKTFAANSSNTYDIEQYGLYEEGVFHTYAGKTFTMRFESKSAIVEKQFTMPSTITKYVVTTVPPIDVPYLFFEDFAGVGNFEKDDYDGGNLMSADGMLFSTVISGWNGAHIKAVAGQCIRINARHESTFGATRTNGRLDTPAMKGIKSGVSVKLKVEFDMGTYIYASGYSHNSEMYCFAGTHTKPETTVLNGLAKTVAFGSPDNDKSRVPSMFENCCLSTGHIAPQYGDDSFGSSFPTYSFTASGCTSTTRLMWVPGTDQDEAGLIGNVHYYLYIDNIRVSIVQ